MDSNMIGSKVLKQLKPDKYPPIVPLLTVTYHRVGPFVQEVGADLF